jgi:pimeloyl-ACP methyl ester carboxylesterase
MVRDWQQRGRTIQVRGLDVFCVAEGRGPAVVLLHGFPTSGFDWRHVLDQLRDSGRRVIVPDMPGFGLSAKPASFSYSLIEQAEVLTELLVMLGVDSFDLVAHDMGTSVACELLARREERRLPASLNLRSLVLTNGSVYVEMSQLTRSQKLLRQRFIGPWFARLSIGALFRAQLRQLFGSTDAVSDDELEALWALLTVEEGVRRLPQTIHYIDERWSRMSRWIPPLARLRDLPVLVLWGPEDPVAIYPIARRLKREIPGARLVTLDGLGHFPQLEDPSSVSRELLDFFQHVSPLEARAAPM